MRGETSLIKKVELFASGKYPHWVSGGEFERLAANEGYKASNASRRARELETGEVWGKKGVRRIRKALERKEEKGSVWYRWIPSPESIVAFPARMQGVQREIFERSHRVTSNIGK